MAGRKRRELGPVLWIPSSTESPVPEERRWTGGTSGNWPCGLLNWPRNGASQQVSDFIGALTWPLISGEQTGSEVTHHAASYCVFRASQGPSRVLTKDWFNVTFAELCETYTNPSRMRRETKGLLLLLWSNENRCAGRCQRGIYTACGLKCLLIW